MRTLGVIPARGGSKRILRKNCRLLHGCPLIGYTIRAAQAASLLTDFVVSTEDEEIKNIALSYGATVVDRPVDLAGDDVTSGAVLRHALDVMEGDGTRYDLVVCLHPTSPIRDPRHIDEAITKLAASRKDYLASVLKLPRKTHQIFLDDWGSTLNEQPEFVLNASIYAMKRNAFIRYNLHSGDDNEILVMDRRHSIDIDTEEDFKMAELFLHG